MPKVLILTSSTGGGHDMRARAFSAWAQKLKQFNFEVKIHHALEETHPLYHFGVSIYNWIQETAPVLHHLYFNFLEGAGLFSSQNKMMGKKHFQSLIEEYQPEFILSVHGSTNHGFFDLARQVRGKEKIRCVTYCGELYKDYGFSRHWVNPETDLFVGAVTETCEMATRFGMSPSKLEVGGALLMPSFYEPFFSSEEQKKIIREKFHLDPNLFTFLLSTSALGANHHFDFLKAIAAKKLPIQIIALCGKDSNFMKRLQSWSEEHLSFPIRFLQYTDEMALLMKSCSAILTRPGSGTTTEAILSECPIIFNGLGGVMPQESLTVRFCKKYDLAEIVKKAEDLGDVLQCLINTPRLAEIQRNMKTSRPKSSPENIFRRMLDLF
jgi:processive 1,2-diacylglycerol beta-glucosyltransferase